MLNNWRKRPAVFEKGLESISQKLSSELIYNKIIEISSSDHVESRTIQQATDKYHLAFGPFSKDEISTTLSNAEKHVDGSGYRPAYPIAERASDEPIWLSAALADRGYHDHNRRIWRKLWSSF